jgi:uncharacterized repeat protein (TIGR01451 family)
VKVVASKTPSLSVVKSSLPSSGSTVPTGTTVTYRLTLTDAGSALATDVTVTDAVPTGTTYVTGSASCGGTAACKVSEATGKLTWTGINVAGTGGVLTITFQVTVNPTDPNGQVIRNVASFTNEGTPSCTNATCPTNTVTLIVQVRTSAPTTGAPKAPTPPQKISQATTAHTGEPFAGSRPVELIVLGAGLGFVAIGESIRRRRKAKPAAR